MNPLQSRKQLLLAESELNRAKLVADVVAFKKRLCSFTERAKSFESIASSAAVLVAGLAAYKRAKTGDAKGKTSWLQTILNGAGLISNLWLVFRSQGRDLDEN